MLLTMRRTGLLLTHASWPGTCSKNGILQNADIPAIPSPAMTVRGSYYNDTAPLAAI